MPTGIRCDRCKREELGQDWARAPDLEKITIEHVYGVEDAAREKCLGQRLAVDLCPDCFADIIIPALAQAGVGVVYEEWEG